MNSPTKQNVGVVTGCDRNHEWLLPWWWYHYEKTNAHIPVTFCNFGGMSANALAWCASRGKCLDLSPVPCKSAWFKKPAAIWYAEYDKVIWIDNDCQVMQPLDPYFGYSPDRNTIAVTYDPHNVFCISHKEYVIKNPVATGVVVASPKNELIKEWATKCCHAKNIRGDQEVLNYILSVRQTMRNYSTVVKIMPPEFQWLRIYNTTNDNSKIFHWTGPVGKEYIKKQIDLLKLESFN